MADCYDFQWETFASLLGYKLQILKNPSLHRTEAVFLTLKRLTEKTACDTKNHRESARDDATNIIIQ